jgi:hypothetical protein
VDLFTREATFTYLKDRKQEKVLSTILRKVSSTKEYLTSSGQIMLPS